jgi:hypothetical protein
MLSVKLVVKMFLNAFKDFSGSRQRFIAPSREGGDSVIRVAPDPKEYRKHVAEKYRKG